MRLKLAAWLVHLYTITGGIAGLFALFEAGRGDLRSAFLLILLSHWIDATDGLLARAVRVWEVLPNFDGSMLDNMIDIFTFLWLPVFIIWQADALPHERWLVIPVIATLYAYGQTNMKSDDNFFIGFPSYWEVVAMYIVFLEPTPEVAATMLVVFGILSFIPLRYLYPSKNAFLQRPTWLLGILWLFLWIYILLDKDADKGWVWLSLFYPIYYMVGSLYANLLFSQSRWNPLRSKAA